MTAPVDRLLERLPSPARRSGDGWAARCPAHDDRVPSLSIRVGADGRALVKCQAGCTLEQVLAAVQLTPGDLFANGHNGQHHRPAPTPYEIRDPAGQLVALHVRLPQGNGDKRFVWERPGGVKGLGGRPVAELPLYGSEHAAGWDAERPVIVTEGEKDAAALIAAGYQAVGTVTGAGAARPAGRESLEVLRGLDVVLWPDNDDVGRAHMALLAAALDGVAAEVHTLTWPNAPEHAGAADFLAGHAPEAVDGLVRDNRAAELVDTIDFGLAGAAANEPPAPEVAPMPIARRLDEMTPPPASSEAIVDGLVRPGGLTIIAAPIGLGKSQVRTQLALHLAAGSGALFGFEGHAIRQRAPVLILDEELGDAQEWEREEAHLAHLELRREGLPYYRVSLAGIQLEQERWQRWLRAELERLDIRVLVLDTISSLHGLKELREELLPVWRFLRGILDDGRAVVMIHHLRKRDTRQARTDRDLDDLRGALWGQVADIVALLTPLGDRRVRWTTHKRTRHVSLVLEATETGPFVCLSEAGRERQASTDDRILAAIDAGAASAEEVRLATGLARSTVFDGVARLRKAGVLTTKGALERTPDDGRY